MFTLPIGKATRVLIIGGLALVGLSAVALGINEMSGATRIAELPYLQLLRVDREANNLPAWYSSGLLLLCATSLACVAAIQRAGRGPLSRQWWVLAALVLVMSIDETVQLHEDLGVVTSAVLGVRVPWMLPAAGIVLAVVFLTRGLWRSLESVTRRRFLLAAGVYGTGAVGMELIYKAVAPVRDGALHFALIHVEESLEMTGVVLLFRAVWLVLAPSGRVLMGDVVSGEPRV